MHDVAVSFLPITPNVLLCIQLILSKKGARYCGKITKVRVYRAIVHLGLTMKSDIRSLSNYAHSIRINDIESLYRMIRIITFHLPQMVASLRLVPAALTARRCSRQSAIFIVIPSAVKISEREEELPISHSMEW